MAARSWIKTVGLVIAGLGILNLVGFAAFWYGRGIGLKRLDPPESIGAYSPPMQLTPVTQLTPQATLPRGPYTTSPGLPQNTIYSTPTTMGGGYPGGASMGMGGEKPVVSWAKPQGGEPAWLIRGRKRLAAEEKIRDLLGNSISFDLQEVTLVEALDAIREEIGSQQSINLLFDAKELEELQVQEGLADKRLNLKVEGSTREILRRVLPPFHLDYVIHADGIEIVGDTSEALSIRTYNLSHLVSNSQDVEKLREVLELTVQPGKWGGQTAVSKSIGPVLVVAAKELLHDEIESMLAKLEATSLFPFTSSGVMPGVMPGGGLGGGTMGSGMGSGGNNPAPGVIMPYPNTTSAYPGIPPANSALDSTRVQTELYRKGLAPATDLPGGMSGAGLPQSKPVLPSNTEPKSTSGEPDFSDLNSPELPYAEVPSGVEPESY